ncbi:MAG: hypothetical protein WDN46_25345 [Methylocella sp.]
MGGSQRSNSLIRTVAPLAELSARTCVRERDAAVREATEFFEGSRRG